MFELGESPSTSAAAPTAAGSAAATAAASAPSASASAAAASAPAAPSGPTALASVGPGEGALNLVAWTGYVVGGTGGEQVQGYDWVTPFETATGCKVNVKVGVDSGEHGPAHEDGPVRRRLGVR